jgi:hypothetical protein
MLSLSQSQFILLLKLKGQKGNKSLLLLPLSIVIRPDPGVDPIKEPGPGLRELTRVNPEKNLKKHLKF